MASNKRLNQVIPLLCGADTDPTLPYSERLYQVAGAAVGFGLQLADCSPAEMYELLRSLEQIDLDLAAVVHSFADAPIQEELRATAQSTGIPILALVAGQILHHFLAADAAGTQEQRRILEIAAAYCLRFTLTWARLYPDQARSYRELIPTPEAAPIRTRSRRRHPKTRS
jgi:hypothetical protein